MNISFLARRSVLLLIVMTAGCASAAPQSDLASVRAHWEAWETSSVSAGAAAKAGTLVASQLPNGCWTDIAYDDQHLSEWRAGTHMERLNQLATAAYLARRQGAPHAALDDAAVHALRCWLDKDLHNPNWWWNEIGAPKSIGRAALLLQPNLTPEDITRVSRVLLRSNWAKWTGQNLVWGTDVEMMRGLLLNDPALVRESFDRMYQEIRIVPLWRTDGKPGEGIEADGSFHQHGAQLYSGGYGLSFAHDVGRELVLSWGTSYQAPAEALNVFSHFLLDGEQWMMRRGVFDYVARGREITRNGEKGSAHSSAEFIHMVQAMASLPLPRQAEYERFAAVLSSGAEEVSGNRAYWDSDYMAHRRPGYFTSVRMLSTRSKNEELVNGEGLRSVHLADGANLLYKSGQEYTGIFPVWDWNQIPGTTALQWTNDKQVPLTGETQAIGQMGKSPFAGEVSDGTYGAAAMMLERGPLTAKKAWFFFDHLYVALGAEIHVASAAGVPDVPVFTTIEQSHAEAGALQQRAAGTHMLVSNNGVGYIVTADGSSKAVVDAGPKTGRWSDIGTGPDKLVTVPVFRLAIDHGVRPAHGAYEYTVLPEGGMRAAETEAASPTVRVLANTGEIQAVASNDGNLTMAVFYAAGSLKTAVGTLHLSAPSMVLLRREGKAVNITASNPLGTALDLEVTLNTTAITMQLPGGMDAGRGVTRSLSPRTLTAGVAGR